MIRLFFTGIKHSGKTTFASRIAEYSGLPFKDADDLIKEYCSIDDVRKYYKTAGKTEFMNSEYAAVSSYIESAKDFIISLGGGASDNKKLLSLIRENGRIIYLRRAESDMLPVILKHGVPAFLDSSDIEGSFHRIYKKRDAIYSSISDLTIDLGPYKDKNETEKYIISKLLEAGYVIK